MKSIRPLVCSTRTIACTNMNQSNLQASQPSLLVCVYTATLSRLDPNLIQFGAHTPSGTNSTNQINTLHWTKTRKLCHSV